MSLLDHEARAMAVKLLTREEMTRVHRKEDRQGHYLLPYEIVKMSERARKLGGTIKTAWGIPDNSEAQARHAAGVRIVINNLIRSMKCHVDMSDTDSRCNFDWHVIGADFDLSYGAAGMTINSGEGRDDDF